MTMVIQGWQIRVVTVHRLDLDAIGDFRGGTWDDQRRRRRCYCCCLSLYGRQLQLQRQMKKTALDIDDGHDIAGGRSV